MEDQRDRGRSRALDLSLAGYLSPAEYRKRSVCRDVLRSDETRPANEKSSLEVDDAADASGRIRAQCTVIMLLDRY